MDEAGLQKYSLDLLSKRRCCTLCPKTSLPPQLGGTLPLGDPLDVTDNSAFLVSTALWVHVWAQVVRATLQLTLVLSLPGNLVGALSIQLLVPVLSFLGLQHRETQPGSNLSTLTGGQGNQGPPYQPREEALHADVPFTLNTSKQSKHHAN